MTAFTATSITLTDRHGNSTTYDTTGATYFEGSTAGVYTDLAMGENVKLELTSTTPQTVTKVTICLVHVFGTVTTLPVGDVITIASDHSSITTVDVSGTTTYTSGGAPSSLSAVLMGSKISAVGLPGTTAGTLNASSVNIWVPRLKTHADGVVTAFTNTSVTLMDEGVSTTYDTTGATYFEGPNAGVYTDLAMGEHVKLDLTSTTPQTVTQVTICLERVFGTVTTLPVGNVITITSDHSGITTVNVVPGTTTYTSGGAPSSIAAVVMGSKISAVGLPGTTAGTFNANSVNIFVSSGNGDDHGDSQGDNQGNNQGNNQGHKQSNNQGSGHRHGKTFGHHHH